VNEEEDRRRLKEKLKEALESARRNHQLNTESEGQVQIQTVLGLKRESLAERLSHMSRLKDLGADTDIC
jgi:hypothetical protein